MKVLLVLLIGLLALVQAKDYYKILDISKDADERTVKQAYRKMSKMYHPDKNPTEEAHEKFIEVGEAYDVLSDPQKRKNYDTYGDPNAGPDQNIDLGDMFNQFFGGMGGMRGQGQQRRARKGDTKLASLNVSLQDFYKGNDISFQIASKDLCSHCDGTGSTDKETHTCSNCNGQGIVQMRRQLAPGMFQTFQVACEDCGGKGKVVKNKCKHCHGSGVEDTMREYKVYVSPGTPRNFQHVMQGEGDQNPEWITGDLVVQIVEEMSDNWGYRRIGNNLYRTEVITLEESIKGDWKRKIPFFDSVDSELELSKAPGENVINNQVDVLKGKGMPLFDDDDNHGDLYIEYKVLAPEKIGSDVTIEKDEL